MRNGRPGCSVRTNSCATRIITTALVLAVMLLGVRSVSAQVLYGSITGTVTDKTGAVIPNAAVSIANQGTGEVRTEKANGDGMYIILDVLPGNYSLSIAQAGNFAGFTQKDVTVAVNQQVRIDVSLAPATVSTQVTITEAAPELQTENAEVDSELSQAQLSQMPLTSSEGRNFQSLYTVIPGAADVQEKNSIGGNPARAMAVNVNGNSYNGNTTRIDGAVNYYGWLPYLVAYVPPADSIESVSFTTDDFNAEQGQAGGASIRVTTKSGTRDFHGGAWWYYQDAAINARPYLIFTGPLNKNVYQEYGGNIGGPVYIPRVLTGKKKLFFFTNFDRITRRQLYPNEFTVPDTNMTTGNFSEAAPYTTLYDPAPTIQPTAWVGGPIAGCGTTLATLPTTSGYVQYQCRPSFTNEYGESGSTINTIPTSRIGVAPTTMMANMASYAAKIGTPSSATLANFMNDDYSGSGIVGYNRNSSDTKITYIPNESTQIFGKYGIQPYSLVDPQVFNKGGGPTFDGGQPGEASGRMQNVGLGMSHVFSATLVVDADFGYTRQVTGAHSTVDAALGDYGLEVLDIPGTNGPGANYIGEPGFYLTGFTGIGNDNGASPFLFRDNQFTGDVNLSWVKGKHAVKFGYTYYHFDLNHFQPTSGGQPNVPRGGFTFQGGMTCGGAACGATAYSSLADFLLGLPNNGASQAIGDPSQIFNPNALRWTEEGAYAQDTWTVNSKLTLTYGVRYEIYPAPYRDHTGVAVVLPSLPQSQNVEVGGVNGLPRSAGIGAGWGQIVPRVGIAYRLTPKTVIRTGLGLTTDPDSMRYLRDSFPEDLAPAYSGTGNFTIAVDPANGNAPMPLTYGIPTTAKTAPNYSSGFTSLPVAGSTNTVPQNFRRGYIESWNLFVQRDIWNGFVGNIGYVGTHFVRQPAGINYLNAAPIATSSSLCMPNGQVNPSTGLNPTGTGLPCSSVGGININQTINLEHCTPNTTTGATNNLACYNTGGITIDYPVFSSVYDALQSQLTRNAGKNTTLTVVYTYSHAIDFEDNGAGSGSGGTTFSYPGYFRFNRGTAGYDQTHNLQVLGSYHLPFGPGQAWANQGLLGEIVGGWQLNGQFSHYSGFPFSINANSNTISGFAPGFGATYAQLTGHYQQEGGHTQKLGNTVVSGGRPWFNPASFSNPAEPSFSLSNTANASPTLPNTTRNEFRGPGNSQFNASLFKSFHLYRESDFQVRIEAFNLFNHPFLNNPNTTVTTNTNLNASTPNYGNLGTITSYGVPSSQTEGSRALQFSGRISF